ncbi:MAG: multidrug transporter [Nitrospirales bacterium]|nr:MAG: multidrug transporter [Nitrospirales bacterium]
MQIPHLIGTILLIAYSVVPLWAQDIAPPSTEDNSNPILTLQSVLTRVEQNHPLLRGSQTERIVASGKLLTALGKFEPNLVNDWELERLVKDGKTTSVGFNDTLVEMRHPWGIQGFAGFRAGIGDVEVADLGIHTSNQPLLGIIFPLLRGFITNPAHAELQKSSLANKQAELEIQQSRQDVYLGAATQYWSWVAARKILALREKAVAVAEDRASQLAKQAKAGARAKFDVIEANQEVQRRRERLIKARRQIDQEQYKLALFLWEDNGVVVPTKWKSPPFPSVLSSQELKLDEQDQRRATAIRPEVQLVHLEAESNHIDLEVAANNFLPDLTIEAAPSRKPEDFVLGLGYRFGAQLSFPFLQREARGDELQMKGKAQRLKLLQQYRLQQVSMDVANARSAITRAQERTQVARQALQLAKKIEKGERTRFKLGATTLLFVNLRERNVLKAAEGWITAMADYQKGLSLYRWAIGEWVSAPSFADFDKKRMEKS